MECTVVVCKIKGLFRLHRLLSMLHRRSILARLLEMVKRNRTHRDLSAAEQNPPRLSLVMRVREQPVNGREKTVGIEIGNETETAIDVVTETVIETAETKTEIARETEIASVIGTMIVRRERKVVTVEAILAVGGKFLI